MAFKIKPEDVPDELIDDIEASVGDLSYMWDSIDPKSIISATINAAIEAGLVSPPCYTVRNPVTGNLFYDVGQVRLRPGKPEIPAHEHYKGQTS